MTEPAQDVEIGDDVIVHFAGRPVSGRPLTVRTGWEGAQYVELPADFAVPAEPKLTSEAETVKSPAENESRALVPVPEPGPDRAQLHRELAAALWQAPVTPCSMQDRTDAEENANEDADKAMPILDKILDKLADTERRRSYQEWASTLHFEGLREHKYAREAAEAKAAALSSMLRGMARQLVSCRREYNSLAVGLKGIQAATTAMANAAGDFSAGTSYSDIAEVIATTRRELATTREELERWKADAKLMRSVADEAPTPELGGPASGDEFRTEVGWCPQCRIDVGTLRYTHGLYGPERCGNCDTDLIRRRPAGGTGDPT
jgi:hypothetical protein